MQAVAESPSERRSSVEIELGGATRRLRFTLNAMAEIQQETGWDFLKPPEFDEEGMLKPNSIPLDPRNLRVFLWACLLDMDPEFQDVAIDPRERKISMNLAASWVDGGNVFEVRSKILESIALGFPSPEPTPEPAAETGDEAPKNVSRETRGSGSRGMTSGQSRDSTSGLATVSSGD